LSQAICAAGDNRQALRIGIEHDTGLLVAKRRHEQGVELAKGSEEVRTVRQRPSHSRRSRKTLCAYGFGAFVGERPVAKQFELKRCARTRGLGSRAMLLATFKGTVAFGYFHPVVCLVVVFVAAAVMMVIGAIASMFNPGRYATAPNADRR